MTLKEKFKRWLDTEPRYQIREVQLEIIAEEFAIGFAEWFDDLDEDYCKKYTIKELLEIYKL
jgi:hypothetical protein